MPFIILPASLGIKHPNSNFMGESSDILANYILGKYLTCFVSRILNRLTLTKKITKLIYYLLKRISVLNCRRETKKKLKRIIL